MISAASTGRWIVTAGLLLGLSTTGLGPRIAACAGRETNAAIQHAAHGQQVCCCGTKDCCCGMACCQAPNPKEDKAPATPTRTEDRAQSLGLALSALAKTVEPASTGTLTGVVTDAQRLAHPSLVSLSIRLNT